MKNGNEGFYDRISAQVAGVAREQKYPNDGTAFGHLIIKECFNKIIDFEYDGSDFDQFIKDHIVDMANDLGNDAIFTNQKNNEILVFQFKYSKEQLLNTDEIKKNKKFIDWILKLSSDELCPNPKLRKVLEEEIYPILKEDNIGSNNFHITFLYIDCDFHEKVKTDIKALHANYSDKDINFEIKFYDYKELEELYIDAEIPENEVELKIVENEYFKKKTTYYDEKETELETVVVSVYANSLKPVMEKNKELMLALNVRYYKGENIINLKIKEEYSKGKKSNFWILNNGISAICEDFELKNNNVLKIKNFQIVNGGQTAKTLTRIVNDLTGNVQILMRLTKIENKTKISKISRSISVASNSQNAISARDLHSGDRIQNKIFEQLDRVGIFYDKKDGEWAATEDKKRYRNPAGKSPLHLKLSNFDLGVAYLSFYMQLPISSAGRHKLVFSDLFYDKIFDMTKNEEEQFYKLILAHRISERVNIIKNDKYGKFEVLWNNYINDVLLSLSALFFYAHELHTLDDKNDLEQKINTLRAVEHINFNDKFSLKLGEDFDLFVLRIIKAAQYLLDVMKQAKKFQGEEWLPKDTNNWLKKDGTYSGIFEGVIKKLKEE
jgi:hypothetical protein